MNDEPNDFERWLIAGGIDPSTIGDDFAELWARFEAWQRRSDPPSQAIVVLDADAERWPQTVLRVEVPT